MAQGVDITKAASTAVLWNDPNLSRGTDGLQTLRWREMDSNPRSPWRDPVFKSAHQWQRAVHNELCDRRNDQVLDVAKFKQGDGASEAGFAGIAPKNYWK